MSQVGAPFRYNRPGSYFLLFCSGNRWVETIIYIPGRRQGDLDSRRYGVGGFGSLFWMNNTVASLLYGYSLVITRIYTILDNTHFKITIFGATLS
jgi:hypothetical protein